MDSNPSKVEAFARIEALEDSLATLPTHPNVPNWLWELGTLWDHNLNGHVCPTLGQVPPLALKYSRYFYGDCCSCESHYSHAHWRDLLQRFPADPRASEAAYLLTAPPPGGECEGWVSCSIKHKYGTLDSFLRSYPASPHAPEAVTRANEAFLSPLTFRPEGRVTYEYDSTKIRALIGRYDTTATALPPPLRRLAYGAIGPMWVALGNAPRAAILYDTLVRGLAVPKDTVALRQTWDSLVTALSMPLPRNR